MTLSNLRDLLDTHFNNDELRQLCLDLSLDYENLPGDTRSAKTQSLVEHCLRHGRLPALAQQCADKRPTVPWPDVEKAVAAWAGVQREIETKDRERLRDAFPDEDDDSIDAMLATRRTKKEATFLAHLFGSGAVAQGDGAKAIAERGVSIENSPVNAPVVTGDNNKVVNGPYYENYHEAAPGEAVDIGALRTAYLGRVLEQTRLLSLSGIDYGSIGEGDGAAQRPNSLPLKRIYTALLTTGSEGGPLADEMFGRVLGRGMGKGKPISALAQLDRQQHLVLLGDPGSGKSTFANFVTACLAGERLGHPELNLAWLMRPLPDEAGEDQEEPQPWRHGALLPLLVVLRDLAAGGLPAPSEPATAGHFWAFVQQGLKCDEFTPFLKREFEQQGGLLLLDGLDEVPEAASRREQIRALVADLKATLPRVRILVTSRIYAYQQQAWELSGFQAALLASFSWGQIIRFIGNWYVYEGERKHWPEGKAAQEAERLLEKLKGRPELQDLAERPLLLALMTSLHAWRGGTLPDKRAQLYNETVDLLLERWESLRVVRDADGQPRHESLTEMLKVGKNELRKGLEKLAYEVHGAQPDVTGGQPADISEQTLINALLALKPREDLMPRRLAAYVRDRAGLLIDRGEGVYTFPHRTFQEFLAACYAADREMSQQMTAAARSDPSRWREVLLLSVAHASQNYSGAVWDFIPSLCLEDAERTPEGALSMAEVWGAHLAGLALVEVETNPEKVGARDRGALNRVRKRLALVMRDGRLPAIERAKAAVSLAHLGDTRREVLDVEAMRFCYVPKGKFHMGADDMPQNDDPDIQDILDSAKPSHEVNIPYDYWLAQFPVTNGQFQMFVDAGGYTDKTLWAEAIAHGYWQDDGQVKGYTWVGGEERWQWLTRNRPYDYGQPFNLPNHPVVGVNWYEALAFTRWLTRKWQDEKALPPDWAIRLPTEAEWEKAARGGLQLPTSPCVQALPGLAMLTPVVTWREVGAVAEPAWGPEQANYQATKIKATSGVGCFPQSQSPYGCEEMLGNVWEWTQTLYGRYDADKSKDGRVIFDPQYRYPYQPDDGRELFDRDDPWARVLRGGCWENDTDWLRRAARHRNGPEEGGNDSGFRVTASPSTSGL